MAKIEITHESDEDESSSLPQPESKLVAKTSVKKTPAKPKKAIKVKFSDEPELEEPPKESVPEEVKPDELEQEDAPEPESSEQESKDETIAQSEETAAPEPEASTEDEPEVEDKEDKAEAHQRYVIQNWKPEDVNSATPEAIAEAAAKVDEAQLVDAVTSEQMLDIEQATLNDPSLDKVVDDVAKSDSDELLQRTDADMENSFKAPVKLSFGQKIKHWLAAWWQSKWARNISLAVLALAIIAVGAIPASRYFLLNTAGVRVSASLSVTDDKTQLPLKNVHITLDGQTATTDGDGKASLLGLKLGPTELVIEKRAFAQTKSNLILGMGSNPLGAYKLTATGTTFKFIVSDWLSHKPLNQAEANSGEASAKADNGGKISLVLDAQQSDNADVTISFNGYRSEKVIITGSDKSIQTIRMVPAHKHLFVSKRSGKYDVYKIDADGKNEQRLIAGSGSESDDMVLVSNPASSVAALVSTRDNQRNKDGFVLSGLYVVDVDNGQLTKLAQSERVQVVDWIGNKLVYVLVAEGASGSNPKRHRLVSYDINTQEKKELASSNYFNDVVAVSGKIYYAPSNAYLQNPADAKLFVVNPDGSNLQTILNREAWNVFRTDYGQLSIAAQQDYYTFRIGDASAVKAAGPPADQKTKLFVDNGDRSKALWAEDRDGKGTLLLRNIASNDDKVLESRAGLKLPIYWLSNSYVVFRVSSSTEIADYVISTDGGVAQKIRDVSNIGGIDKWYFY